jgi:hypothetical protein
MHSREEHENKLDSHLKTRQSDEQATRGMMHMSVFFVIAPDFIRVRLKLAREPDVVFPNTQDFFHAHPQQQMCSYPFIMLVQVM